MKRRDLIARTLAGSLLGASLGRPTLSWATDGPAPAPLDWLPGGRPGALARQAVALLADAASQGLDPQDYQAQPLAQAVAQAAQAQPLPAEAAAQLSQRLSSQVLRYLRELHGGRVSPRQLQQNYDASGPRLRRRRAAAAGLCRRPAGRSGPGRRPAHRAVRRLRETLAATGPGHARRLAAALPALPASRQKGRPPKLEAGQAWAGLDLLRQRLQLLGDLDPRPPRPPSTRARWSRPCRPSSSAMA
jgi:murein L,D-transpeptidase YcbB/YkuD